MSRRGRNNDNYLCNQFQKLSISNNGPRRYNTQSSNSYPRYQISPPKKSEIKPNLFNINWQGPKIASYRNLHPSEGMYDKISSLITNEAFVIENIVEVNNPFLEKAYQLKKAQKKYEYGQVHESLLFHGTKKCNVESICNYNFDWRLYGSNSGHKYGRGVSFSTNAKYASEYCDEYYHKVMIVAKVLIVNVCKGHPNMTLPPPGYDTSQKGDHGIVTVKYEDNEFYPAYKLYFHIEEEEEEEEDDDYYDNGYDYDDYYYGYDYDDYYY